MKLRIPERRRKGTTDGRRSDDDEGVPLALLGETPLGSWRVHSLADEKSSSSSRHQSKTQASTYNYRLQRWGTHPLIQQQRAAAQWLNNEKSKYLRIMIFPKEIPE